MCISGESEPRFGCPENWVGFRRSCYRFLRHTARIPGKTWEEARAYCRVLGGDLASIGDVDESNFIRRNLRGLGSAFWVGLYRNSSGEVADQGWVWTDGTELTFKRWAWREPNNWNNSEKCGEVYASTSLWNDISCSETRSTICERKGGTYVYRFVLSSRYYHNIVYYIEDITQRCENMNFIFANRE